MILGYLILFTFLLAIALSIAHYKRDKNYIEANRIIGTNKATPKSKVSSIGLYAITGCVAAVIWLSLIILVAYCSYKTDSVLIYLIFAFFGWKSLNKIQPSMFIWMPFIGWIIYFLIKFLLSTIVGLFVTPVVTFRFLINLINRIMETLT